MQKPATSGTPAATAPRSAARSKSGCSPGPKAAANAAAQAVAWQALHQRALEVDHILPRCIADADPVTPGYSLVIPRRHGADGLALHQPEWNAVVELLKRRREQLNAQDASISAWNVGFNSGEAAGQTVFYGN